MLHLNINKPLTLFICLIQNTIVYLHPKSIYDV
jgi:hypothetical protein